MRRTPFSSDASVTANCMVVLSGWSRSTRSVHQVKVSGGDISFRQKLRENFLSSPFLKRYFTEDAAIAVGVLYKEWLAMKNGVMNQSGADFE